MNRRSFISFSTKVASISFLFPCVSFASDAKVYLRPPGALEEKQFLSTCIKCGQCVQVCPYYTLNLMDINSGFSIGTPCIYPSKRGCYLCDLFPCILACPSGALDYNVTDIKDIHLGIAVISNLDSCLSLKNEKLTSKHTQKILNFKVHNEKERILAESIKSSEDKNCDLCVKLCPYPNKQEAIDMINQDGKVFPVIKQKCVGCGVCSEICPKDVINIIPNQTYEAVYKG